MIAREGERTGPSRSRDSTIEILPRSPKVLGITPMVIVECHCAVTRLYREVAGREKAHERRGRIAIMTEDEVPIATKKKEIKIRKQNQER